MQTAHFQCCHNYLKCIFFRKELELEVEQMCTTYYWIDIIWQHDQGITWHVGWGLLILVTTLLSLWALGLVKVRIKYFWFVTWSLDQTVTWLFWWGPFILSHHPAKFGIHRPWESGDITSLICHMTTWSICYVILWVGSLHPKSPLW